MAIFDKDNPRLTEAEQALIDFQTEIERKKSEALDEFHRLHREGYDRFGLAWIQANNLMSALNNESYLPKNDPRIHALLSKAAWVILENVSLPIDQTSRADIVAIEKAIISHDYIASSEVRKLIAILNKFGKNV